MRRAHLTTCWLIAGLAFIGAARADDPPTRAQLEQRIRDLERKLRQLEGVVEGTARPINLARTSLARVGASSVNGSRPMDNRFYGVANAFDDGQNWHDKINYTYWLAQGGAGQWIDVEFEVPVTLVAIGVEQGPAFVARLSLAKGGQQSYPAATGRLEPSTPVHGVSAVRLTFAGSGNIRVHEVRILGHAPAGVRYTVGRPRLRLDRRSVELTAREAFTLWRSRLLAAAAPTLVEEKTRWVVVFAEAGRPVFRVTIDKASGKVAVDPRVQVVPVGK